MVAAPLIFGRLIAEDYEDAVAADPRIDGLRAKMVVQEDKRYSREYLEADKRSIANAIQVFFKDGTHTPKVEVEYPVGHRRRREEGSRCWWRVSPQPGHPLPGQTGRGDPGPLPGWQATGRHPGARLYGPAGDLTACLSAYCYNEKRATRPALSCLPAWLPGSIQHSLVARQQRLHDGRLAAGDGLETRWLVPCGDRPGNPVRQR